MKRSVLKIMRPTDGLLPAALLVAALLGRASLALWLYISYFGVKLCALATSDGLRIAFSRQPSVRSVQGSTIFALILQVFGALIATLIAYLTHQDALLYPLIGCGLLINIEHVFYEYLFAISEDQSAVLYQSLASLLTLVGLLLCAPAYNQADPPKSIEAVWLLAASGVCALAGLTLSLTLGGKPKPKMNAGILRCAHVSMLQAALYPASSFIALRLLSPGNSASIALFCGLILYELCRSPFRRTPSEAWPMNQALLIACAAAALIAILGYCLLKDYFTALILPICLAVIMAALCAFALFGSLRIGRRDEV